MKNNNRRNQLNKMISINSYDAKQPDINKIA